MFKHVPVGMMFKRFIKFKQGPVNLFKCLMLKLFDV